MRDWHGEIIGTADWSPRMWAFAEEVLRTKVLAGVGDESRERFFRMCITACLHRGVRDEELALIPRWWHDAPPVDIAGGPVEILSSKGIPDIPSAQPCHNPRRQRIDPTKRPDLWIPLDCGVCPPCRARAALDQPLGVVGVP